jgi:porphobilinogen synthase
MAIKFGRPIEMRDTPRRQTALASASLDLAIRPRRNRKSEWARRLVRENVLTTDDLIWPLFVVGGQNTRTPVASMPGVDRLTVDQAVRDAERAAKLDIPCIALFPYTEPSLRDETGGAEPEQSGLPGRARHQEGISRYRRALRCRARSLHQPRP